MKAILSPAKNMRLATSLSNEELKLLRSAVKRMTTPQLSECAQPIAQLMQGLSIAEASKVLKVNEGLATEALANWHLFNPQPTAAQNALPALAAFDGIAYKYLDAITFSAKDWKVAQKQIRIVDATFGLLRAKDAVLPHRLDFGSKVLIQETNLYSWWSEKLINALDLGKREVLINLASAEYAKAILPYLPQSARVITCDFKIRSKGKIVTQATWAKMARGAMTRYMVTNAITTADGLKNFDALGFEFQEAPDEKGVLTFICENPQVEN